MRYVNRNNIDPNLWNACVEGSSHYLPYAQFEYLDAICNGSWGALILGRYEAVFPLPFRKKWGLIPYVYQPAFCQQLGVFGDPGTLTTQDFIKRIPKHFLRVHLQVHGGFGAPKKCTALPNRVKKAPHDINKELSKDALKNIRKVEKHELSYTQTKDLGLVLRVYHRAWGDLAGFSWPGDYSAFESAATSMMHQGKIYACVAQKSGELWAAALFLKGEKTLHYVCAAPTEEGRKHGIMHGVIKHAMEHFPDYNIDFEGSQIESVARFYQKFGGKNEAYYRIERTLWV